MTTALLALPRMQPLASSTTDTVDALACRFSDTLGYTGLRDQRDAHKELAVFAELGCMPFEWRAVRRYRFVQMLRANWVCLALPVAFFGLVFAGSPSVLDSGVLFGLGSIGFVASIYVGFATMQCWFLHRLKHYTAPVPIPVLEMAERVQARLPDAVLYIEALERKPMSLSSDPFLCVRVADRLYRIAVWDEPRFDATVH